MALLLGKAQGDHWKPLGAYKVRVKAKKRKAGAVLGGSNAKKMMVQKDAPYGETKKRFEHMQAECAEKEKRLAIMEIQLQVLEQQNLKLKQDYARVLQQQLQQDTPAASDSVVGLAPSSAVKPPVDLAAPATPDLAAGVVLSGVQLSPADGAVYEPMSPGSCRRLSSQSGPLQNSPGSNYNSRLGELGELIGEWFNAKTPSPGRAAAAQGTSLFSRNRAQRALNFTELLQGFSSLHSSPAAAVAATPTNAPAQDFAGAAAGDPDRAAHNMAVIHQENTDAESARALADAESARALAARRTLFPRSDSVSNNI